MELLERDLLKSLSLLARTQAFNLTGVEFGFCATYDRSFTCSQEGFLGARYPEWSLGCRRLTPGNGYLETLTQDNVELLVGDIAAITPKGIRMTDGREPEFDAIIRATGFDVSFKSQWTQLGRGGKSLAKEWAHDSRSYFSLCVSGYPNHFIFNRYSAMSHIV